MAHEVESMFYTERQVPWHGLGTPVREALKSVDALKMAGLDWDVIQQPVFLEGMSTPIPNYKANVRSSDNAALGIVSDRYRIVQNKDAFDFTDSLIDSGEVFYETAGSLKHGRTIWLLAKMPEQKILDDKFDPYLCFTNSHDGTGAVNVCMTSTRVVCNNTLNIALRNAQRKWSCRHTGNIKDKMLEARHTLELANIYMNELNTFAEQMASEKLSETDSNKIIDELFKTDESMSQRQINNINDSKEQFIICTLAPDLMNFMHTKWHMIQAAADFASHSTPNRMTSSFNKNRWGKILNGHPFLDKVTQMCCEVT